MIFKLSSESCSTIWSAAELVLGRLATSSQDLVIVITELSMKQTARALLYLLSLALTLVPVFLCVTLPLLLVTHLNKYIQHEDKNKKKTIPQQDHKTVLITGAPHTKVSITHVDISHLFQSRK